MGPLMCWNKVTSFIVNHVEHCFYNLGIIVGKHPWRTVGLCWLFVLLSSFGLFNFYKEKHPFKLWVPPSSDFARDTEWLINKFHIGYRPQYILATAPNILNATVLTELAKINERINEIQANLNGEKYSWTDMCFKIPIITSYQSFLRRKRSFNNSHSDVFSSFSDDFFGKSSSNEEEKKNVEFDPSVQFDPMIYCSVLEGLDMGCLQKSILDIWKYNVSVIEKLTPDEIIENLNKTIMSPVLGHDMGYVDTLGGIETDGYGKIISAKSVIFTWWLHVNFTGMDMDKTGNDAGTEEWASEASLAWEKEFLDLMNNLSHNVSGLDIYYEAGRSYGDISGSSMFQDMDKLVLGITIMFIYIQLIISKFKWVEVRFTLGSVGLLSIGMALIVAVSVCSLLGIPYGPVHSSLPFLIMGLGIDDMFVMKACWEQLTKEERMLPLHNQIGLMLKHAGVSIIITSFTDIVAFLVGSITILPSLQAFCLYAAVGVFFVFIFSVTFYVAIFVLDCKRIEQKRNGIVICIKHPDYIPTGPEEKSISQKAIHYFFSKFVLKKPVKIAVIVITLAVTGYSVDGLLRLEQRFDPAWFIPDDSYFKQFLDERTQLYPEMGNDAIVFIGAINYTAEFQKIYSLVEMLNNNTDIIKNVDSWTYPLRKYILDNFDKDILRVVLTDNEWNYYISKFLFSPSGATHQSKFRFTEPLKCGEPASAITVSSIDFRFKAFTEPSIYLPAMHKVKALVRETNFETGDRFATVWAKIFANWVTDEVIHTEVERNLELALVCVMACTVILITDIQICFWIFACVLLTLVNVCGWMYRWNLTIDIVSCVGLELAIGLCVDYAAHVGHTFLTVDGTRDERAFKTVTSIGAAVLYGGGSTFLALSVLSLSKSYIFKSFFKIFLLVIVFGLFHGIIFLPVVLSIIGPKSYHQNKIKSRTDKNNKEPSETGEQLENLNSPEIS